ncbi:hypothetical protein [Hymenobacter jejuensis]|uniref:Lipoprotein n=1 Tax=Hymenobacter jejuensis TaxID=2502781 RepID=A0A5B8A2E1_9BACT|nr:hypothetical protein [Hymenobacter jejuensis]QDA60855.1 hypothetical protein FHG12_12405 [Hymenobacter jejuensis]
MSRLSYFTLMRCLTFLLGASLLSSVSLLVVSCNDKDDNKPVEITDAQATVKLATSATLGPYLTDSQGNTLYFFARDVDGTNACTGGCTPTWPVYYEPNVLVTKALNTSDFGSKTTPDGRQQTTYKGWPLYYYAPAVNGQNVRELPGETRGNGVGTIWHVVNPGYSVVIASKSVVDKTTNATVSRTYLTDTQGRTMYVFAKDTKNPNTLATNCTGSCATTWPPVYMSAPTVPSSLKASDFGTITRTDAGSASGPYGNTSKANLQLTYKGRPLYYYIADNDTRGRVEGHDLNESGDLWFAAAP